MKIIIILFALVFLGPVWAEETGNFYNVRFVNCYDGDTCTFRIPWLPAPFSIIKIRVEHVDTPERRWRAKCEQERNCTEGTPLGL